MDNPRRRRDRFAVGVNVRHDIMADFLFPLGGALVVDIRDVRFQSGHLFRRDGQAQVMLRPGQGHPQPPPGLNTGVGGKQIQHEFRRIAGGQRGFITVF